MSNAIAIIDVSDHTSFFLQKKRKADPFLWYFYLFLLLSFPQSLPKSKTIKKKIMSNAVTIITPFLEGLYKYTTFRFFFQYLISFIIARNSSFLLSFKQISFEIILITDVFIALALHFSIFPISE